MITPQNIFINIKNHLVKNKTNQNKMRQTKQNKKQEKFWKTPQIMEVYNFSQESLCAKHVVLFFIVAHNYFYFTIILNIEIMSY